MKASQPFVIVVGMDFSELSNAAFDEAMRLAALQPHTEIHALHVDSDFRSASKAAAKAASPQTAGLDGHTTTILDRIEAACNDRIERARERESPLSNIERVVTHFRLGSAADQVVQLAVDLDADLVVVGTHGRTGLERLVLGSVANKVLRTARCPVYVVRPKDHLNLGDVPEIEPACPDCVTARKASDGAAMWCKRHSEHHIRPHRYTYQFEFGEGATSRAAGHSTPV